VPQVNQQANPKKASTIPCAILFILIVFSFYQFDTYTAKDSRAI
jgi:hypothetical protein